MLGRMHLFGVTSVHACNAKVDAYFMRKIDLSSSLVRMLSADHHLALSP